MNLRDIIDHPPHGLIVPASVLALYDPEDAFTGKPPTVAQYWRSSVISLSGMAPAFVAEWYRMRLGWCIRLEEGGVLRVSTGPTRPTYLNVTPYSCECIPGAAGKRCKHKMAAFLIGWHEWPQANRFAAVAARVGRGVRERQEALR